MKLPSFKTVLALVVILLLAHVSERPASAQGRTTTFALIVTSNRSTRLSRPDLRYADDDGGKYYATFRMLAPESNVALLTSFDRDSEKLFPQLVAKQRPPSKVEVKTVARDFAERVRVAKQGGNVDFYFVFAGHGDIDNGKGFLELADGAFTSDDLESLLKTVDATRSHVILDSCNSFFVVNARKPGGRHFVTSEEATKSLSERMPSVGVFLSTSAEASVYEWSELQSGVFSHAVRSGLSGAADANGDGRVSYDELRAFVSVASRDIKNPNYRPQVFARGPAGRGDDTLVELAGARAVRVRLDATRRRLTVRDLNDVPWVDLHNEEGLSLTLRLPAEIAASASLEERDTTTGATVRRVDLRSTDEAAETLLASLPVAEARQEARGPDEMFRTLFASPFGARAFAQVQADETTSEPPVLGVSSDERERLRLVLRESADGSRRARLTRGALTLTLGAGVAALGAVVTTDGVRSHETGNAIGGGVVLGSGLFLATVGVVNLVRPGFEERTFESFGLSLSAAPDTVEGQRLHAEAERRLFEAAEKEHKRRVWSRWFGFGAMVAQGALLTTQLAAYPHDVAPFDAACLATGTLMGGAFFVDSFFPSTTERMAELWKSDPGAARSRSAGGLRIAPYFSGLGGGVSGTF